MTTATKERIETTVDRPTPVIPELPPNSSKEMKAERDRLAKECADIDKGRAELRKLRDDTLAGIEADVLNWSGGYIADELRHTEFDLLKRELAARKAVDVLWGQVVDVLGRNRDADRKSFETLQEKLITGMAALGFDASTLRAGYRDGVRSEVEEFLRAHHPEYKRLKSEGFSALPGGPEKRRAENNRYLTYGLEIAKRMTIPGHG